MLMSQFALHSMSADGKAGLFMMGNCWHDLIFWSVIMCVIVCVKCFDIT